MDSKAFLAELQEMVVSKHSKDHPLFDLIENGELDQGQLHGFVKQFYQLFPKPFPKPIAAMFAKCPDDAELEQMWLENVLEEASGSESGTAAHKQLYIDFAGSMGIPRAELDASPPLPETSALLIWRELLINQRSWLELYASQGLALEGTASPRMRRVVNGLVNHYGYTEDSNDLMYWTLHMSVDEDHMKVAPYAILKYAHSEDSQTLVRESVKTTLDQFWLAFDGMKRAFVDNDSLYSAWREPAIAGA
jgi:pyrroloquinoline quinone (PQQ) biosynthesis protein C